ncbi:nuclear transport factor 2 family protein [Halopenitus sp. H-Gu1]|uniref:nuclear transport factor 2 family protein n=1 Tax=Halopenitus sp. H-Gu1 TaxID=3242697 RepID=UPI00359E799D
MDGQNRSGTADDPGVQDLERLVHSYYATIDDGDYEGLSELLDPEFVHDRPDRTLTGRDRFLAFMREKRPRTDTEHVIDAVYANGDDRAVRGSLLDADGNVLFAFVDVFSLGSDRIDSLRTYTRQPDARRTDDR